MAIVIDFVRRLAPWVYGACVLMALWYLRVVILARRERRYAVFKLERETALNRVYSAWLAAIVIIMVMGVTYVLSTTVSDAVQPLITEGQPTPTPTGAALVGAADITPTLPLPETTPTSTATRRPRPTARPQPTPLPQNTPIAVWFQNEVAPDSSYAGAADTYLDGTLGPSAFNGHTYYGWYNNYWYPSLGYTPVADVGYVCAIIPEPATLGLIGLSGLPLVRRRR